jgi:hypothetical protein
VAGVLLEVLQMKPPLHVYPINDIVPHTLDGAERAALTGKNGCLCGPEYRHEHGRLIVVHKSFDGREVSEWIGAQSKFQLEQ